MAKPTVFTWATNANYGAGALPWSATTNKTAPVAGLIAEGWEPLEHPAADNLNHMFASIGDWIEYLDTGILEGPIEIDGRLHVNPVVPLAVAALEVSNGFTRLEDVTVDGALTLVGDIKHGDRTYSQDPLGGVQVVATVGFSRDGTDRIKATLDGASSSSYQLPIRGLKKGDRLKTVKVYADSANDGAVTLCSHLDNNAGGFPGTAVTQTFPANGHKLITLNSGGYTLAQDEYVSVLLTTGITNTDFFSLIITYDRP